MDKEKLFRQYLYAEMNHQEMDEFEAKLDTDEALRQEFRIFEVMYQDRELRVKEAIKSHSIEDKRIAEVQTKSIHQFVPWLRAVAAVLVISCLGYFMYDQYSPSQPSVTDLLAMNISDIHLPPPVAMGEAKDEETPWQIAIEAYRQQQYEVAVNQIKNIEEPNEEQLLYLGLCHMYKKVPNFKLALDIFSIILADEKAMAKDQALWYSALIHLQLGNKKIGVEQLSSIVESKSWKYKNAAQLLGSF